MNDEQAALLGVLRERIGEALSAWADAWRSVGADLERAELPPLVVELAALKAALLDAVDVVAELRGIGNDDEDEQGE